MNAPKPLLVVAALVGPAALSFGVVTALESYEQTLTEEQQTRNRRTGPAALNRKLADLKPRIVALGNSVTNADVDEALLGKLMGVQGHAANATSPGSLAPTWYLTLKNRVYGGGHTPDEVLIVNPLENVLEVQPASEIEFDRMMRHMGEDEPVLKARMGGQHPLSAWAWQLRARRARAREDLVDSSRDGLVSVLYGPQVSVAEAFESVFSGPVDPADHHRILPVVELDRVRDTQQPDASFLVDMFDLADAHDSRLSLVIPPILDPQSGVSPAMEEAVRAYVEQRGGRYIDLSEGFAPELFRDAYHLQEEGAEMFTRRLAAELGAGLQAAKNKARTVARSKAKAPAVAPVGSLVLPVSFERSVPGDPPLLRNIVKQGDCHWTTSVAFGPTQDWSGSLASPIHLVGVEPLELVEVAAPCSNSWNMAPQLVVGADPAGLQTQWVDAPDLEASVGPAIEVWVPPGSTATWEFDGGGPEEVVVFLRGRRWGSSKDMEIVIDGSTDAPNWSRAGGVFRRIRTLAVDGPWSVAISVPDDGAPMLITRLTVAAPQPE